MSRKSCDHTSVGMIVCQGDQLLLIERRKPPFGFAAPAGHVDDDGSYEIAARRELNEEVGLTAVTLTIVLEKDMNNVCRRQDGIWHHWKVYEVTATGDVRRSEQETNQAIWASVEMVEAMAAKTRLYEAGEISEEAWRQNPGLEAVWYEHFEHLGIIRN